MSSADRYTKGAGGPSRGEVAEAEAANPSQIARAAQ